MVIGGLYLLSKGIISINKANKEDAITLEFKNQLKVTSHYPAIALFIIGFGFSALALHTYNKAMEHLEFKLVGHVNVPEPNKVRAKVVLPEISAGQADNFGRIIATITPRVDVLDIRLTYPGYVLTQKVDTNEYISGEIDLQDISLESFTKIQDFESLGHNTIVEAVNIPPINSSPAFGTPASN